MGTALRLFIEGLVERWAMFTYTRGRYKGLRNGGQDD